MAEMNKRLKEIRAKADIINSSLQGDLAPFYLGSLSTFKRIPTSTNFGITTTCSCLMALTTVGSIMDFFKKHEGSFHPGNPKLALKELFAHGVQEDWESSGLKNDNPFSSIIVLRTAALLTKNNLANREILDLKHPDISKKQLAKDLGREPAKSELKRRRSHSLSEILKKIGKGVPQSFMVEDYPSTPAIGYWFVDSIESLGLSLTPSSLKQLVEWISRSFSRNLSLVTSGNDAQKDPVQMAMAACLAIKVRRLLDNRDFRGRDELLNFLPTNVELEHAILKTFSFQEPSGIWPKYFPLFNYKEGGVGSNYFFSFELLEVIIQEFGASRLMENDVILSGIERALSWCETNRLSYYLGPTKYDGWNSGGQIMTLGQGMPESWATAVVHMFAWKLRVAMSQIIEKNVLSKYGTGRESDVVTPDPTKWDSYLDSPVYLPTTQTTVKTLVKRELLSSLTEFKASHASETKISGRRSVLLFGPPGTAKTSLVRAIARKLGWPLVELNPSDFLKEGLDSIYSQANEIFADLRELKGCIVFFDEMDATTQSREGNLDVTRQFLTTSMLPKLALLHDDAQTAFFMATNHQQKFDAAIKRPGRFDLLICLGPSTWSDKLRYLGHYWPTKGATNAEIQLVADRFRAWIPSRDPMQKVLDRFTFGEFRSFLEQIAGTNSLTDAIGGMDDVTFRNHVKDWGEKYIVLRETARLLVEPTSPLEEYKTDLRSSRVQ